MADRATSPREWAIAIGGGLLLAAGLVWMLRGSGPESEPVALSTAPAPAGVAPPPAPVPVAIEAPAPAPAPADTGGYTLHGLIVRPGASASAIIESADGRQRLVRAGSLVGPGARVESIDSAGVVIADGGGRKSIGFAEAGVAPAIVGPVADPVAGPVSAPLGSLAATANDYRLGLKARKVDGRTTGFVVTDLARLPALRKAGMMPGDVLVSLNGSAVESEEKLLEMPAEIAGAYAVDVVFERAGRRQRGVVAIER